MKLKDYQIKGAEFLVSHRHALLADDMGLGKTAQAICGWVLLPGYQKRNVLVICPASVKYHWEKEFKSWGGALIENVEIIEGRKYKIKDYSGIVIVNYELLLSDYIFDQLKSRQWDVLICDEAHYLKTLTSKRSKRVLGIDGLVHNAKYKWMLTGTPIESRPVDLFPMLKVLHPEFPYDYERYVMRFCDGYYDHFTGDPMPNGASNEIVLKYILEGFMLRRTLEDELPETDIQVIRLKKNIKINGLELRIPAETYMKPMNELGALASVRQEVALAKLPQAVEYIRDVLNTVDKVVVFAYHRAVINQLEKSLNAFHPAKYYGGMNHKTKEQARQDFMNCPNVKVFIGQIQAAGTGLDGLQEVAHYMIFVELDWNPFRQCIGRLRRIGQKKGKVIVQLLVTKDSIEEQMLGTVNNKLKSIDKILS